MSIIDRVRQFWRGGEKRSDAHYTKPRKSLFGGFFSLGSPNVVVNPDSVNGIAAASSCIKVISEDLAKQPIHIIEATPQGKFKAKKDKRYTMLHLQPNPQMNSFNFRRFIFRSAAWRGNGFAIIQRDYAKRPVALWPVHPDDVTIERRANGSIVYKVLDANMPDGVKYIEQGDMIHVMSDSDDGIVGNSPIKQHERLFGEALATSEFGLNFFRSGGYPGYAVVIPPEVANAEEGEQKEFKKQFNADNTGVDNHHKVIYIPPGGDVKPISATPQQASLLELRKYLRSELAGIYRVPLHKIADLEEASLNNIEEIERGYVHDTLMPYAIQFEQECMLKLFTDDERDRFEVKFNFDSMLRGKALERAQASEIRIRSGQALINETRDLDDLPPLEGGDKAIVPANWTTLERLGSDKKENRDHWTLNEKREADGKPALPGGDAIYMPANHIPAVEAETEEDDGDDEMEGM